MSQLRDSNPVVVELESLCGNAKKIVCMDFAEETWPKFGFRKGEYAGIAAAVTPEKIKAS